MLCNVMGTNLYPFPMPKWNDEAAYYELLKTWLFSGQPLGYWGFDGAHAIWGTGSAWSSAIIFPYAVFVMMFGLRYSSVFFANICFLCIANIIFILLVNPQEKQCVRLIWIQIFSVITILYSQALMSEPLRYALIIIMAGMFYRLYFMETGKIFRYVFMPLYILTIIQVYIFMVFVVPIYVFGVWKKGRFFAKALVALFATGVFGGGSYVLLHFISSNYNIYKTEILLEALSQKQFGAIVSAVIWMIKEGIHGLLSCFLTATGYGIFKWFILFLVLLIILPIIKLVVQHRKDKSLWDSDMTLYCIAAFSVCLYVGAYITVYSLEPFTFFRGVGIVVIFSMYLFSNLKSDRFFSVVIIAYAIGMLFFLPNFRYFSEERYLTEAEINQWTELESAWEQTIEIHENKEIWDNTVALFTLEPKVIASIPAGAGVNMILYSEHIPEQAGYLIFSLEQENRRSDWLEHDFEKIYMDNKDLLDCEYSVVYTDEDYIVYKRK